MTGMKEPMLLPRMKVCPERLTPKRKESNACPPKSFGYCCPVTFMLDPDATSNLIK